MVSREDVVNAFRMILGREPENEEVVTRYAAEVCDVPALRKLFLGCAEFQQKHADLNKRALLPMSGPPMAVDIAVSPDQLAQLFARTGAQWQHLGETEPHWSVLTSDSYFQKHFHMHRDAFYASGRAEVAQFGRSLERALGQAGLKQLPGGACLELGCGVGRVTGDLARRFPAVIGVDVSDAHLKVAEAYLRDTGVQNVRLHHLAEPAAVEALPPFSVLYSRIVLQHNPPPVTAWLLDRLLERLDAGGVAYFQIPTYKTGYRFRVAEYLAANNLTRMEMHFLPQAELFRILARHRCELLEIREDDAIGLSAVALSNTVLARKA